MAGHDFISFMSKDISLFNGKMLKTTLDVYVNLEYVSTQHGHTWKLY